MKQHSSLRRVRWAIAVALVSFGALAFAHAGSSLPRPGPDAGKSAPTTDRSPETHARDAYSALPLAFERNEGQGDPSARFFAHGQGYALALAPTEASLSLSPSASVLHFRFSGANPAPAMRAEQPLPGVVNSFIGNDPAQWRTNIPTAARVRYTDLYPGIDLTIYGTDGGGIEYDVIVAPGADPAAFALSVGGATDVRLDAATSDLVLTTAAGEVRQHAPVLYQEIGVERRSVTGGYAMRDDGTVGFRVGEYDPTLPLVIDPMLVYSTYLGGSGIDGGYGIAVDTSGNAYVNGFTRSTNFPVTTGPSYGGGLSDAFVTKFNGSGTRVYSTYLGGSGQDQGYDIAVDTHGNAYVTGLTASPNFPVTTGAPFGGSGDAFVTELNGSGALVYSTYLGGAGGTTGIGIAVDTFGNAYVTGGTNSLHFPVTNGSMLNGTGQPNNNGDAFVTKLDGSGALVYSTYLGGSGDEYGRGIAVDASGNAYVTGSTSSTDFPVTNASTYGGGPHDAFVTKFNAIGTRVYGTYLGGSDFDQPLGIAVDTHGNAYVTGITLSTDFPVTNTSTNSGGADAFVTKLDGNGARVYSTYLGGSGSDQAIGIAVDASGNAYVTGGTGSTNFPITNGSTLHGTQDAFVTELNGSGALVYSTYLGGSGQDQASGIAVDTNGNVYVTGSTLSTDFPVTNGSTFSGGADAFVTRLSPVTLLAISPATLPNGVTGTSYSQTITAAGGTFPYAFAVPSGTLPPGLTLAPTGMLSGTPTTAGSFMFTITATDHFGVTGSRSYTVVVTGTNLLPPSQPTGAPLLPTSNPLPVRRPTGAPLLPTANPLPPRRP